MHAGESEKRAGEIRVWDSSGGVGKFGFGGGWFIRDFSGH